MIPGHQPSRELFPPSELLAAVSSLGKTETSDGNMAFGSAGRNDPDQKIAENRWVWLQEKLQIPPIDCAVVYVKTYDRDDFTEFRDVQPADIGLGMLHRRAPQDPQWHADMLVTEQPGVGLFLTLGDCGGGIIYDKTKPLLAMPHLGRHSTMQDGARKAIEYLQAGHGCDPSNLKIWVSPTAGKDSYAMEAEPTDPSHHNFVADPKWKKFRKVVQDKVYLDLSGYNRNGFIQAGVPAENIQVSTVDTATSPDYPSHSQGDTRRFAIVAMMRASSTPHLLH